MRKTEIPQAENHSLIYDYVSSYALYLLNYNSGKGTKQLEKHCADLEKELFKRGLLTEDELKKLNG